MIDTHVEIAASPAKVREMFLDFSKLPEYHSVHLKGVTPLTKNSSDALAVGSKLHVELAGVAFDATIMSNSPTEFSWLGRSILGLINGLHTFEFLPSDSTPGGTTFVQKEEFSGWLGFLMTLAVVERKTAVNFGILNQDLKRWVEGKGV